MPAPGDQHSVTANPFEEPKQRVSDYTAQEIATLQSRLEKQLGPEYISARSGPSGQKVHYIAAEKCIALANEVFGFNGWSSSIQNIQVDFVEENAQTLKVSLGLSVIVRVTLRDGTYHEDIGYGHIENCKGKAAAFEKAKKEGTTDALKRTLRNFGNVLGNCIYDKAYLAKVTKLKVEPTRFDEAGLHRHSDYARKGEIIKKEEDVSQARCKEDPSEFADAANVAAAADSFEDLFGEFDEGDFCVMEEGHPDEVALPTPNLVQPSLDEKPQNQAPDMSAPMQPPSRALGRSISAGNNPRPPQTSNQPQQRPGLQNGMQGQGHQGFRPQQQQQQANQARSHPQQQQQANQAKPYPVANGAHPNHSSTSTSAQTTPAPALPNQAPNIAGPSTEGVGFFSARAVKELPEESLTAGIVTPNGGLAFNPRAESPSIRKTPGIDHTKSKPLAKNGQHVPPTMTTTSASVSGGAGTGGVGGGSVAPPNGRPGAPSPAPMGMATGRGTVGNVVNPQLDQTRRIGAPAGASSPLANRGQYRPPTIKRSVPVESAGEGGGGRPALADVSNSPAVPAGGNVSGPDAKRQKIN